MKSKKIYLLSLFFFFLFIYNFFQIIEYSTSKYAFQYGDWLINYSNGFVRRGLIGEFFLILRNALNINLELIYVSFLTILLIIFYYKNYLILKKMKFNFLLLTLIFSPFLYLFTILNHSSGIRKEYLLFFVFVNLISYLTNNLKNTITTKLLYMFFFILLLFIHELSIFFLPFFLFLFLYSKKKIDNQKYFFTVILFIFLSFFTIFIIYIFRGNSSFVPVICQSVGDSAYENCLTSGAIYDSFNQSLKIIFFEITNIFDVKGVFSFLFVFCVFFIPFIFFFTNKIMFKKFYLLNFQINQKKFLLLIIFNFFYLLPLFLIGADWGRWISIFFFLFFYIIIFLSLKKNIIFKKKNFINLDFFDLNVYKKILIIIFFIFYSTFMTPGVFYQKVVHEKAINFNYIKIYKKFL